MRGCIVHLLLVIGLTPVLASAQPPSSYLITQTAANSHGLKRAWFAQVDLQAGQSQIIDMKLDAGTLFVQTSAPRTVAIDAETGRTLWVREIGSAGHPTLPLGVSDQRLALCNGSTFYVIDRQTGQVEWSRRAAGVINAGPAVTEEAVFVPANGGQMEVYSLVNDDHRNLARLRVEGRELTQPVVNNLGVAWGSGRGDFAIGRHDGTALLLRQPTNYPIIAAPGSWGRNVYVGNTGGFLLMYDNTEKKKERWTFATGMPINQSPLAFADAVYVMCEDLSLFRVAPDTGRETWVTRGIRQIVAASPTRLYAIDRFGRLAVLNPRNGAAVDLIAIPRFAYTLTNSQSDLLVFASQTGLIQALHEIDLPKRIDYRAPKEEKPKDPKSQPSAADKLKAKPGDTPPTAAPPGEQPPAPAPTPPAGDPFGEPPLGNQPDPFGVAPPQQDDAKPAEAADPFGP